MVKAPGLRYWRERRALTMRELAAQAGVAYTTVFRIEHGKDAELPTLRKLSGALGIEPHLLMEEPGEEAAAA